MNNSNKSDNDNDSTNMYYNNDNNNNSSTNWALFGVNHVFWNKVSSRSLVERSNESKLSNDLTMCIRLYNSYWYHLRVSDKHPAALAVPAVPAAPAAKFDIDAISCVCIHMYIYVYREREMYSNM